MINEKISKIAQRLWDLNESKLTRKVDYELDLQEPYNNELPAEVKKPVLSITMDNLTKKPTFKTFLALLSKYIPGACERMTEEEEDEEIAENDRFVNSCLNTNLMKEAHRFLVEEGKAPEDTFSFKEMLREIWFDFYSRREKTSDEKIEGLSTFQHVFVGDYKGKTKVLGCHYWLDYYALQRKALVSYHGYIPSGTVYKDKKTEEPALISIAFTMDGVFKPTEVFLIGLSPEFEFALYTIIFLCGETRTRVKFANLEVEFYCHKIERDGREFLAALYPTEAQHE